MLVVGRFGLKGVQFIRTVILAHLLFPDDFGLFGLASLTLGITSTFFVSGLNASLIQNKDEPHQYLNGIWTVGIVRNIVLALVVCIAAPFAGDFFGRPDVVLFIYALAFALVIDGFVNPGIVLLQKDLHFNKKFIFDIGIVAVEVVGTVVAAIVLQNAWALVIGAVLNKTAAVILSYKFSAYRPRLTLQLRPVWRLFQYGKWISITAIISFFITQGDNLTIGKILSAEDLGFYQLAFALAFLPAMEFSRVMGNVLFPLYAKIREDKELLLRTFVKVGRIMFAVATPLSFGLLALLPAFVEALYGERWLPMVPIVNVLLIYGLVRSFEFMVNPLVMGLGRPETALYAQLLQFVGMFLPIVPLTYAYGVVGTAWSVVIGGGVSVLYLLFVARKILHFKLSVFVELLGVSTAAALSMYCSLVFMSDVLSLNPLFELGVGIVLGAMVYLSTLFILDSMFGKHLALSFVWLKKNL